MVRKMNKVDWLARRRPPGRSLTRRRAKRGNGQRMKIRAQIGMVLNLDKCIGCHTCSSPARTSGPAAGRGIRLVQQRRDQARHRLPQGNGRTRTAGTAAGRARPTAPSRRAKAASGAAKIFANPDLPQIDDYYEPFTFDYDHLQWRRR